jgi:hypothetical protein
MNLSFILLLIAAGILRYVAVQARSAYVRRLTEILPRKVTEGHLQALFDEYRPRLRAFRAQALPYSALELFLNAFACAVFVAALWTYPPQQLSEMNVFLVRYCSAAMVLLAFLGDLFEFGQLFYFTFARAEMEEIEEAEEEA